MSHTPAFTLPSLVLAQELYGSVDQEADIIARNSISNPLLVIGGTALEVLGRDE